MEPQRRERGIDLESMLNPKSRISGPSTFFHLLWLKKWKLLAVWAVLAVPVCIFLALYDIPRTYESVSYLRFPRVTGGSPEGPVRDVSLGEAQSVVRLFQSRRVMFRTIEEMGLRMEVVTKEVFRKHVIRDIAYSERTPAGRYRLHFPGGRRVRVEYRPWGERRYRLFADTVADASGRVPLPGGRIGFPDALLELSDGFRVDMIFRTPDEALADFGDRLEVTPLDKGQVAVNYAVSLRDRDPFLVADAVNRLTAEFIRVYTGTSDSQDREVLERLETSLAAARDSLDGARERLADFYREHRSSLVAQAGDPAALADARARKAALGPNLERLEQTLAGKPGPADETAQRLWVDEVLALLSGQGVPRAEALRDRLASLQTRKAELTAQYNPAHPLVVAVDGEMESLYPEVERLARDTRDRYKDRLAAAAAEIGRNRSTGAGGGDKALEVEAERLAQARENAAKVVEGLQAEYDRATLGAGPGLFQVQVMDAARPPLYAPPTLRGRLLIAGAAALAVFFVPLFWFLLSQLVFPRVWNKDDAERMLKLKVAGSLFHVGGRPARRAPAKSAGGGPIDDCLLYHGRLPGAADVEAYRALRVEIEHLFAPRPGGGALTLLIASTAPGEGKSTVAANLAIGFARRGRRTLLVDADFRHGRQERMFGFGPQRGLIDLLRTGIDPDFGRRARSLELPTVQAGLSLMPKGRYDESATEAVYRSPMQAYLRAVRAAFEVVIIDGPPVIVTADPLHFAAFADGVLYVLRSGQVPAHEARRALEPFLDRDVPIAAVLNGIRRSPADENYFARYGYYYAIEEPQLAGAPGQEIRSRT